LDYLGFDIFEASKRDFDIFKMTSRT